MASKRKQKKLAKKNGSTAISASQMGNPKPDTSVAEAMKKAKDAKDAAVEKVVETSKTEKVSKREIIGFGSASKGSIIHAITNRENTILCDTRRKNYAIDLTYTHENVNCVKCKKFAAFKNLAGTDLPVTEVKKEPEVKTKVVSSKDISAKSLKAEDYVEDPKVVDVSLEVKDTPFDDFPEDWEYRTEFETLKNMMDLKFKRLVTSLKKQINLAIEKELGKRPEWLIVRKSNGKFAILHDPSRYEFVNNLTESQAEELLIRFTNLPIKWDGLTKPPKAFVSEIKNIRVQVLGPINTSPPKEEVKKPAKLKRRRKIIKVEEKKPEVKQRRVIKVKIRRRAK